MEKNLPNHIDRLFEDALGSFEARPGEEVWEKIGQELDKDKRRSYFPLLRSFSLIAACLLVLGVSMGILFHSERKDELAHTGHGVGSKDKEGEIRPSPGEAGQAGVTREAGPAAVSREAGQAGVSSREAVHAAVAGREAGHAAISREAGHEGVTGSMATTDWFREFGPLRSALSSLHPVPLKSFSAIEGNPALLARRVNGVKKDNPIHLASLPHRWSVSGYFSQELTGYNLAHHESIGARGKEIDKKQTSLYSASGGLLVGYRLTKKWLLQTGLVYSWSRSLGNPSTAYAITDNNGNIKYQLNTISGYGYLPSSSVTGDSVKTGQSSSRLHYLSIPVIASYTFHARRWSFLAGAGVIGNFLTGATVQSRIEGAPVSEHESIVTLYGLKKMNYGLFFKTEAQFAIRSGWSVNLMVTSKNALTAINTNVHYSTYPYYIGLGLGLKHSF